jgi:hypothetical protein
MKYQALGYDTYDDYLNGEEWQEIRDYFYSLNTPYRCRVCHRNKKLLVHKRTYYALHPSFFKSLSKRMIRKILVYLCVPCNDLVHFYDGRKKKKAVPLDYVFLWDREQVIFFRPDRVMQRLARSLYYFLKWLHSSYWVELKARHRKKLAY